MTSATSNDPKACVVLPVEWLVLEALPVVVPESDVSTGLQDLAVLQPGELRLRLTLGLAGERGGGADGPCHRLRRLAELCRG